MEERTAEKIRGSKFAAIWQSKVGRAICIVLAILLLLGIFRVTGKLVDYCDARRYQKQLVAHLNSEKMHVTDVSWIYSMDLDIPELTNEDWEALLSGLEIKSRSSPYMTQDDEHYFIVRLDIRSFLMIDSGKALEDLEKEEDYFWDCLKFIFPKGKQDFIVKYEDHVYTGVSEQLSDIMQEIYRQYDLKNGA